MIDVVMPQMGESLAEGTVVRWLKQAGDRVERDEPLFEISTDKVDTDVPSPASGTLHAILVPNGQTVAVGAPVGVIDDGRVTVAAETTPAMAARASGGVAAANTEEPAGHFKSSHAPQLVSFRREAATPSESTRAERSFSPAVLDTARRANMPLHALTSLNGSGRGGRVTKADVRRFVESGGAAERAGIRQDAARETPAEYLYRPGPDDRVVPMSPVRRRIADHMSWSVRISPHASAFADCDMTDVTARIKHQREAFAARAGAPLTVTVAAAVALAATIRDFPALNASVVDDAIVIKPRVHLGIAVALPDSDDLIVPVVHDADGLSIAGMARAIADLSSRARERRLRPEDVQGGTITLTNPGMFGGITGTPILNQPQVAIVGLGAIARRAMVLDGDRIAPRSMMTIAVTFDHRAIDGVIAFKFLDRLRGRLEAAPDEL